MPSVHKILVTYRWKQMCNDLSITLENSAETQLSEGFFRQVELLTTRQETFRGTKEKSDKK